MTVITVNLADWIIIVALVLNAVCSVVTTVESRRIRKRKAVRIEVTNRPGVTMEDLHDAVRKAMLAQPPDGPVR